MKYKINWDDGVFAVPDKAADCLKLASGKAVKVLLYLLRFKTEEGITENLGITEEDFEDSISYWISTDILSKDGNFIETPKAAASEKTEEKRTEKKPRDIYPEEIAEKIEESEKLKELFSAVEAILGRSIRHSEQCAVLNMTESIGLPPEVIVMIFGYCASIDKLSVSYAEKVAVSWADEGINTAALADSKILSLQKARTLASKCASRMFYSSRALTKKENEYISKWAAAGADIELIMNAYDRTVDITGKAAFPYMDKIISEWTAAGISSSEEADKYSESRKPDRKASVKKQSGKPSFDLDLIMEHAKNTPLDPESKQGS